MHRLQPGSTASVPQRGEKPGFDLMPLHLLHSRPEGTEYLPAGAERALKLTSPEELITKQ